MDCYINFKPWNMEADNLFKATEKFKHILHPPVSLCHAPRHTHTHPPPHPRHGRQQDSDNPGASSSPLQPQPWRSPVFVSNVGDEASVAMAVPWVLASSSSAPCSAPWKAEKLKAPFIITCVGSITTATLGLANATAVNTNEALGRPVSASMGPGF